MMLLSSLRVFSSNSRIHAKASYYYGSQNARRICDLIEIGDENMEDNLNKMNARLSPELIVGVLRNTSGHAHSALRFFTWAKSKPGYKHSSAAYNEMINIAGASGDFESMGCLIEEMIANRHSLTRRAFLFLISNPSVKNIVEGLVDRFSRLGYSARMSAFQSLVFFLCKENIAEIGTRVFLQGMIDRGQHLNLSCYNALLAARCRAGDLIGAKRLLDEIKESSCKPNISSYNYLLGTFFKKGKIDDACELLERMEKSGQRPDRITYEILICHACQTGRIDGALEILNKMIEDGLRPRYSTYAAFIKGYFYENLFEESYDFIVETSKKDPSANSMNYMLLASLFFKSGMIIEAQKILLKMIEKGLVPKFSMCRRAIRSLFQNGKQDMAQELKSKSDDIKNTINKRQRDL